MRIKKGLSLFLIMIMLFAQLSSGLSVIAQTHSTYSEDPIVPSKVIDITAGNHFTLAIKEDGTVWSWGQNNVGQLGIGSTENLIGSTENQFLPQKISGLKDVIAVAAGGTTIENSSTIETAGHSIALKSDGTVWAWGLNNYGQVGEGTTTNRTTPYQVKNLIGVTAIASGSTHNLALKQDGTVWAWGNNASGQLGNGTKESSTVPVQVLGLENITAIFSGLESNSSFALAEDGTMYAWGSNWGKLGTSSVIGDEYVPAKVTVLENVTSVASGSNHTIMVNNAGEAYAWGDNFEGRLGIGNTNNQTQPVKVDLQFGLTSISTNYHSLGLTLGGQVMSWGQNAFGALGNGTTTSLPTPGLIFDLSNITKMAVGNSHSVAMTSDGELYAWGLNYHGQLGNETPGIKNTPQLVNLDQAMYDVRSALLTLTEPLIKGQNTSLLEVTTNLELPTESDNGSKISWASSDKTVLTSNGTVTRPDFEQGDKSVELTALVSKGYAVESKIFSIVVKAKDEVAGPIVSTPLTTEDIKITNNRDGVYDWVVVSNLSSGDFFSVYRDENAEYSLGSSPPVREGNSSAVVSIAQLGSGAGSVFVTVTRAGNMESELVEFLYDAESLPTDLEIVTLVKAKLVPSLFLGENAHANNITKDLQLPTEGQYGATISWESSNQDVLTNEGVVTRPTFEEGNKVVGLKATIKKGTEFETRSYNLKILAEIPTDTEKVESVAYLLTEDVILNGNTSLTNVTGDLNLPTRGSNGTMITWDSSDDSVIATSGKVTRPLDEDINVTLTATITSGTSTTKVFDVVVIKVNPDQQAVKAVLNQLTEADLKGDNPSLDEVVTHLTLPVSWENGATISWTSSKESINDKDGHVNRPSDRDEIVKLTAKVSSGAYSELKTFTAIVLSTDAGHQAKVFAKEEYRLIFDRKYYQTANVELNNLYEDAVEFELVVDGIPDDLTLDFAGKGGKGEPIVLLSKEQRNAVLAVSPQDTTQREYKLIVKAVNPTTNEVLDTARLKLNINFNEVKYSVNQISENPNDLSKTFRIMNEGDTVTDFSVVVSQQFATQVSLIPNIHGMELHKGQSLDFTVRPKLDQNFTSLNGTIVVTGAGDRKELPVSFTLPEGKDIREVTTDDLTEYAREQNEQTQTLPDFEVISTEQISDTDVRTVLEDKNTGAQIELERTVKVIDRELTEEEKAGEPTFSQTFNANNDITFTTTRVMPLSEATGSKPPGDGVFEKYVEEQVTMVIVNNVSDTLIGKIPIKGFSFVSLPVAMTKDLLFNGTLWGMAIQADQGTRPKEDVYAYFALQILKGAVTVAAATNPAWLIVGLGLAYVDEAFKRSYQDGQPVWYHLLEMLGFRCINRGRLDSNFSSPYIGSSSSYNIASSLSTVLSNASQGYVVNRITMPYGGTYYAEDFTYSINGTPVKSYPSAVLKGPYAFSFDTSLLKPGMNNITEVNTERNARSLFLQTGTKVYVPVQPTQTFHVAASSDAEANAAMNELIGKQLEIGQPKLSVYSEGIRLSSDHISVGDEITINADINNMGPLLGPVYAGVYVDDQLVDSFPLSLKAFTTETIKAPLNTDVEGLKNIKVVLYDLFGGTVENGLAEKNILVESEDTDAPTIQNVFPYETTGDQVVIGAEINDQSPVEDIKVTINGQVVNGELKKDSNRFWYTLKEELQPGDYSVSIQIKDKYGNTSEEQWTMVVSQSKSLVLDERHIKVVNNTGASDEILITNTTPEDVIKVYRDTESEEPIKEVTVLLDQNTLVINNLDLGTEAGSIFITRTSSSKLESNRLEVAYAAETSQEVPEEPEVPVSESINPDNVTIVNNQHLIDDEITVTGINSGDLVKVYKTDTSEDVVVEAIVSEGETSVKLLVEELGTEAGSIFITVTNPGKQESERTEVQYAKEVGGVDGCVLNAALHGTKAAGLLPVLRDFRDGVLMNSETGKGFVKFYYTISPKIINLFSN